MKSLVLVSCLIVIPAAQAQSAAATPPLQNYLISPSDVVRVDAAFTDKQGECHRIRRRFMVRPDGTISLATYGSVLVAGRTTDQAAGEISRLLATTLECSSDQISVTVAVVTYRGPHVWVITHIRGQDDKVYPRRLTGSETVLDMIASVPGLPPVASRYQIWIARPTGDRFGAAEVLPVDWPGITQRGNIATNHSLRDGDRVSTLVNRP